MAVARRAGDRTALLEVLLMTVPTNYVPWRMDVVVPYADELLELAREIADPANLAKANLWGFISHMSTGSPLGDERLQTALRLSDELGQPSLRWLVTSWHCHYAPTRGDLAGAQELLDSGFALGQATGQPDAFTWYAGQLWVLLRERGELTALLDTVETETARNPGLPAWECVLGTIYCSSAGTTRQPRCSASTSSTGASTSAPMSCGSRRPAASWTSPTTSGTTSRRR